MENLTEDQVQFFADKFKNIQSGTADTLLGLIPNNQNVKKDDTKLDQDIIINRIAADLCGGKPCSHHKLLALKYIAMVKEFYNIK
jgi:hypothetical protein